MSRRPLLPRTQAIVVFRQRSVLHGVVVARVAIARPDGRMTARSFRLRM
jgi:tellurite resistance protein